MSEEATTQEPVEPNLGGAPTTQEPQQTDTVQQVLHGKDSGANEFLQQFPDELRDNPTLQKFESTEDLAKSYINLQSVLGRDKITIPDADAPEEQWSEVYNRLGRPETADSYDFSEIQLPEGVERQEQIDNSFKEVAHKLGFNPMQATALYEWSNQMAAQAVANEASALEDMKHENMQSLQNEWGKDFQYNLNKANNAMKAFADESVMQVLEQTGLNYHPGIIKMMHQIGASLDEDTTRYLNNEGDPSAQYDMSAADAQKELTELMSKGSPYWKPNAPGHVAAKQRVEMLNKIVHGVGIVS